MYDPGLGNVTEVVEPVVGFGLGVGLTDVVTDQDGVP